VRRPVLAALVVLALAGCGGSSSVVAHVGDAEITRDDLDVVVQHFKNEADAEGRSFPRPDTPAYRAVERQSLQLLVYRSELEQSADKLGVPVTEAQVQARLQVAGEEAAEGGAFVRETIRAQIAYEHIYSKVTSAAPLAQRERAMRRWLDRMKARYEVSYEAGFGPAS
jgi:hypothetical protein